MAPLPVALVTAGTAGLGAAVAKLFARSGMRVVVNYNSNEERAEAFLSELRSAAAASSPGYDRGNGKHFIAIRADLGSRDDCARLVAEAAAGMGGQLDTVFSNGGWTRFRGFVDLDANAVEDDWDRCFAMNVKSHLWLMQAAKPLLERSDNGVFVTTASVAGVKSSGSSLAYSVTKAAQIHLVKGLAILAAPKIRVNTVSPGLMVTEWTKSFPEDLLAKTADVTRLKRLCTTDEVAEQVLAFVRCKGITGVNAVVDGGFSI